jgi:hypothetical protein
VPSSQGGRNYYYNYCFYYYYYYYQRVKKRCGSRMENRWRERDVEGDYYYYYGESQLPGVSAMPWPARDGNGDCEDDDDDGE